MKIAIIGTNGLPAKYGGFETLTNYLSLHLAKSHEVNVYCSSVKKKNKPRKFNGVNLIYFPFKANGWQSLIYDFATIVHALFRNDVLVVLGLSGAFAFPLNFFFKRNIIFNIGGIEWKKVRGNKITSKMEIVLKKKMEKICVENSRTVVIDNLFFENYIKKKYNINPILAEYGGNHVSKEKFEKRDLIEYPFLNHDFDLSISRAQSDMNIHIIIEAYKKLKTRKIVIISNWFSSKYGQKLFNENYKKNNNIILLNAIFDLKKLNKIRSSCLVYIHSHSLCGTAPSLVEIMNISKPVICFNAETNRYTTENKSLYFDNHKSLQKILKSIDNEKLKIVGKEMGKIAKKRYSWNRISKIYESLLES